MQVGEAKALHTATRNSGLDTSSPDLPAAWESVRQDATVEAAKGKQGKGWCLFSYSPTSNTVIELIAKGSDGFEGLRSNITDDMVAWAGISVCVGGATKFVRLMFLGSGIAGMKRGKASMHKNSVFNIMEGAVCDVTFDGEEGVAALTLSAVREAVARALRVDADTVELS